MRHVCRYRDVEFYVKSRGPGEFVAVVAGTSVGWDNTVLGAEQIGKDAIDGGARTQFTSTISWPEGNSTSRDVDLSTATGAELFSDLMFRSVGRGATVSLAERKDG